MAFPKNLLADHEKLIFDLKPHWVAMLPALLWLLVGIGLWVLGYQIADSQLDEPGVAQNVIAIVMLTLILYFSVFPFLRWQFTRFVLTSDRLITRSGVIAKHSREIPLERINDVTFTQSVTERFLGAGDLLIESAGERGQSRISSVRKPEDIQLLIYKTTEENNNRMMRPDPAPAAPDIPAQIEALARLRDNGTISEVEFETKKSELLGRL